MPTHFNLNVTTCLISIAAYNIERGCPIILLQYKGLLVKQEGDDRHRRQPVEGSGLLYWQIANGSLRLYYKHHGETAHGKRSPMLSAARVEAITEEITTPLLI